MEEQRARQEDEARKAAVESAQESGVPMADDKGKVKNTADLLL